MFEPALKSLRLGGRQVAIASAGDRRFSFDLVDLYHNLSRLIGVDSNAFTPSDVGAIADEMRPGFESNVLRAPAIELIPFEGAVEAYKNLASGQARAKQVLMIS